MSQALGHKDEKDMSVLDIEAGSTMLELGRNKSSATTLSGTMRYMLKRTNASAIKYMACEARHAFKREVDMTPDRISTLSYLTVVIEEGLSLCLPITIGFRRLVSPGGSTASGGYLLGGTNVFVPLYASNRSSRNFANPVKLDLDRWQTKPGKEIREIMLSIISTLDLVLQLVYM